MEPNVLGQATLKPGPAPTGRDRLFDVIYNALGGTPDRRWYADKATTVLDWGTLGMLTGAYDGGRELAETGRPASLAMALMPGAKGVRAAGEAAETAAKTGIRAFHGSPHGFDKFDMNKIGGGDGGTAYGHGLYFAEAEPTARSYRDGLVATPGERVRAKAAVDYLMNGGAGEASPNVLSYISRIKSQARNDLGNNPSPQDLARYIDQNIAQRGHMYEVNINARPEDFIDWEKPIGQQSEKVRIAFDGRPMAPAYGKIDGGPLPVEKRSGGSAYTGLAEALGRPYDPKNPRVMEFLDNKAATQALRESGIAGIRHTDGATGKNNYTIFDDSLIEILRKYGLLPPAAAGAVMAAQPDEAAAAQ